MSMARRLCSSAGVEASATANQTNLALVSAISLNAYGAVTGDHMYTQAARRLAKEIYTNGLGTDLLRHDL